MTFQICPGSIVPSPDLRQVYAARDWFEAPKRACVRVQLHLFGILQVIVYQSQDKRRGCPMPSRVVFMLRIAMAAAGAVMSSCLRWKQSCSICMLLIFQDVL